MLIQAFVERILQEGAKGELRYTWRRGSLQDVL
jgi:hypothetical protein